MIGKHEFLEKYNIAEDEFNSIGMDWAELEAVVLDFDGKRKEFVAVGNGIIERLVEIPEIHSIKMRVKDPEHLIEKIIRKRKHDKERRIDVGNYLGEITDLVGVRALHLFKEEWIPIHNSVIDMWALHETPKMFIRNGDSHETVEGLEYEVENHVSGYRSVHYLLESQPTKLPVIVELQVRTIFEEAWSEIDHRMRYPYDTDNKLLAGYLSMFNRLAGNADEMGSYIKVLKEDLKGRDSAYESALNELEEIKNDMKEASNEKAKLQRIIDQLSARSVPKFESSDLGSLFGSLYLPNESALNALKSLTTGGAGIAERLNRGPNWSSALPGLVNAKQKKKQGSNE